MPQLLSTPTHVVSIIVDGREIKGFNKYQIKTSLTDPVDSFTVAIPFRRDVWDLCQPDTPVRVLIDGTPIITGRIEDLTAPADDVEIVGSCNMGRIYDDCTESVSYGGLSLKQLIEKLAKPFFQRVEFTNVKDRALRRGRNGKKARAGNEPAVIEGRKKTGTQIEPGQTRWAVLEQLLDQTGLLAWSSGDGTTLIVSRPNYSQEVQFGFFRAAQGSRRAADSNVLSMTPKRSTGDRYSRVMVVGSGPGTAVNFGAAAAARFGNARNDERTVDGTGLHFRAPKRLVVQRSISSVDEADELAEREMAKRDARGDMFEVNAPGHGQRIARAFTTLFANDLLARVEDERTGILETYSIVSCTYSADRKAGCATAMDLVRKGSVLA